MRRAIVLLMGCSGKSAIAGAITRGERELIDLPLPDAVWGGAAVVNASNSQHVADIATAREAGQPVRPHIDAAMADADCLVLDPWYAHDAILAECADDYDIASVWAVAPTWLVHKRLHHRYAVCDTMDVYDRVVSDWLDADALAAYYTQNGAAIYADTRDWPIRRIDVADVAAVLSEPVPSALILDVPNQYQQALHINGVWHGAVGHRRAWEAERLDIMLPGCMDGMTLLDVGASDGGFCYEACHRGARYCTALELRPDRIEFIRRIRDQARLPITTARLNVVSDPIPMIQVWEEPQRYTLGLLLNVLHHMGTEATARAVLGKVIDACDTLVIEGPFCAGDTSIGTPAYPNALCISDAWVAAVAAEHGHRLIETEASTMQPPYRRVWRLEREGTP